MSFDDGLDRGGRFLGREDIEAVSSPTAALFANGPGELWGWCRPLAREMSFRGWNIHLHLLRCPFATGREREVALSMEGIDVVTGPSDPIGSFGKLFNDRCDVVIQLGGDLMFGRAMAAFHRIPLACYSYGYKKGLDRCDLKATAFDGMARSMGKSVQVVGDLVSDGLRMDPEAPTPWRDGGGKRVLLFPGSRPWIRDVARGYLSEMVPPLVDRLNLQVASMLSPFSRQEEVESWRNAGLNPFTGATGAALADADLAVTQPGTNTLELLDRAVPSIVAIPFDFLRSIPLSGIKGWLFSLPGGSSLKEKVLRRAARKRGFVAWPNRLAEEEIMPELVGDISPVQLADAVANILTEEGKLSKQRVRLEKLRGEVDSPSSVFCDLIERLV
ncbi:MULTISPECIES: hypothetical protein [Dethiosulfovibrio]|uniref:Lipid-A-disaccharide synthase n=2 Tax=Dethiosulfovibrio TaxID=47054 RepID=A0ABS9EKA4_9BACT|nr:MULTISPECIES: hypothetical protein [Dethiosulfovibrio]MCF4113947.1 hypothetical protein [Dethiosulfovibrio russensis]MCF4141640.1 hypothetical protein [Dethiosulfovibrio marinus]MCF4143943.1 hypothetical protein [Dethiosulfovibrio acidaminovorans]MEA3284117.1 hypothetical protein [Synergistota bacterium]